jgi:cytochrome d ubiquinol oxidase subunit I
MNVVTLSQWQFAITSVYHFFFIPLTIGLSILVAVMETIYVRSGQTIYKDMAKFWGKLFLINFAMGVVTGIVQEFQFGMNWANYSRFVGDIFGAPLAIEALLAFFLESTFLGVWVFGWNKLSKGMHVTAIWLVAIGSTISALWILIANSFMQQPVGYTLVGDALTNKRAVMTDFGAVITNPHIWTQFPHTVLSGFVTAAFFVIGISAFHLFRKQNEDFFRRSFQIASVVGILATFLIVLVGHSQAQHMVKNQPMKMAAAEALWEGMDPASFSLITIGNEPAQKDVFAIRIPRVLSLLSYNQLSGRVEGIKNLQAEYEAKYGPGDYVPPVAVTFHTMRGSIASGKMRFIKWLPLAMALPYLANTTGWMMTEMGRQPWVVFGLMKVEDAGSPSVSAWMVLVTLIGFALVYGALMVADIYLLVKYARVGPHLEAEVAVGVPSDWD